MPIKDALLTEYDHEIATTRRLLERVPEDKLDWKPHDKSMTLGGLATHLTNLPLWGGPIFNELSFDMSAGVPGDGPMRSRQEILRAFDEATKRTRGLMDKSDAEYKGVWTLKRGGHDMFSLPRAAAFKMLVMNHIIHHRGQLSVYLRLNDVPVPPMYGPTADEG